MNKIPIENFIYSFERNLLGSGLDYFIKPEIYVKRCFFENYFNDIEHGFFHAFCCCLVSYLINNYDFDNLLISSLLNVSPGINPLFFNQKIAQKLPLKKIPSTAANATNLS